MKGRSKFFVGSVAVASLAVLGAAGVGGAGESPPKDGKVLSGIVKQVEEQNMGVITDVEFDDGFWEVEVQVDRKEITLYVDPQTGQESRRTESNDVDQEQPPKDGKALSEILKSVEDKNSGAVCEVEFDDGYWEIEVRNNGKKTKLDIDPKTGETRSKGR